nr:hypothetical protein Iba_scaffold213128CG0010 [Ipomoea batatas]
MERLGVTDLIAPANKQEIDCREENSVCKVQKQWQRWLLIFRINHNFGGFLLFHWNSGSGLGNLLQLHVCCSAPSESSISVFEWLNFLPQAPLIFIEDISEIQSEQNRMLAWRNI